jgi:exopolysaccharide production protein ExoQ
MPPIVALTLSLAFTVGLIVYDRQRNPRQSLALWLPCLWLIILGSRPVSLWLTWGAPNIGSAEQDMMEGSPLDRNVYALLMLVGLIVLLRRKIAWGDVFRRNIWLTVFVLYCGLSILWSDFPAIAAKRWVKSFGDPIMVLIVLTEAQPAKAVEFVLKRCAFLLIPMSIVFIKYYGELGRVYDYWTGAAFYTGVTTNKNMLGYLLFIFGLFFTSTLIGRFGRTESKSNRNDTLIAIGFLAMIAWLFNVSDSKTPLLCLIAGIGVLLASRHVVVRKYWGSVATVGVLLVAFLQLTFNLYETVITSAGRDVTLTGRTDVWASVIELSSNPLLGAGYNSFWLGERLQHMWALYFFRPTQAHNGYLEIYINLGLIGLVCLLGLIFSAYRSVRDRWEQFSGSEPGDVVERDFARFGMACLVSLVIYNVTEATFQALNLLFILFLVVAMQRPRAKTLATVQVAAAVQQGAPPVPGGAPAVRPASVWGPVRPRKWGHRPAVSRWNVHPSQSAFRRQLPKAPGVPGRGVKA